jgi:two-component system sensor histidine kinase CreC
MKLGLRVFLGYFFTVGLAAWLALTWIERELRPLVRQASEEALVETAYALAASVQPAMSDNGVPDAAQMRTLKALTSTRLQASIWGIPKEQLNMRVYVTDKNGAVTFDSHGTDTGKDFSKWNDVYLTLQGKYGVRSTRADPNNEASAVMHVAAPIMRGDKLIGVLTVAMPSHSTQAYLQQAKEHLHVYGIFIILASLLVGAGFTWWLIISLRRIGDYAEHATDRNASLPKFAKGTELEKLTSAIDTMRNELEGQHYLENYIHHLTHELKSPLSAIRASNELLADSSMPEAQRIKFVSNVEKQCTRLQILAESLLQLIRLEKKRQLDHTEKLSLSTLVQQEVLALQLQAENRGVVVEVIDAHSPAIFGDPLLLSLAIRNLLENALQFADQGSTITVNMTSANQQLMMSIHNQGSLIPDYALQRLGERFYSLPHPDGSKGTGLGIAFVKEIAALHNGSFTISNVDHGVCAELHLPL